MSKRKAPLVLRCVSYSGNNLETPGYFAECIDLNLMVWRPSMREAINELNQQLIGYLESMESEEEFEQLVLRKAPFYPSRARYHFCALKRAIPGISQMFPPSLYDMPVSREHIAEGAFPC